MTDSAIRISRNKNKCRGVLAARGRAIAKAFDPVWNADVRDAWYEVFGYVIKHKTKHY